MTPQELLKRYEIKADGKDVLIKYERQLWQAKFSPCGKYIIACGYDATIQRWDLTGERPKIMSPLLGHNGWVQSIDFQSKSEWLVSADSWGQLACWSYANADTKPVWSLPEAHDGWIRAVAVSPDGQSVATGGNEKVVRLWSTKDGKLQTELPHPHRVFSLRFHPNGKSLVSGDLEGVIREWDLASGKETRQLDASALYSDEAATKGRIQQCGGARTLEFDAKGTQLVSGGQKTPSGGFATGTPCVMVFDWVSGKQIREMPMGGTQDGFTYDARFHPDGFVMSTSSAFPGKGLVSFWRPEDDKAFFTGTKLPNGRSLSLHPDGRQIAHLTSNSRNRNGRPDGEYVGGTAVIRLMEFPAAEAAGS